jgi:hypothetical protein
MKKTFSTISEFKKKLQIGDELHGIQHTAHDGRDDEGNLKFKDQDLGVREVSIKQTNSFALRTTRTDGKIINSWCDYPKARECVIKDNVLVIYTEDFRSHKEGILKLLTYKFV